MRLAESAWERPQLAKTVQPLQMPRFMQLCVAGVRVRTARLAAAVTNASKP
jgi:hypothetical protein